MERLNHFFSLSSWAGLGVIVGILGIIVAILLAVVVSGGSSNSVVNNVNGSCNAAGSNNTVSCPKTPSGAGQ
jgi:hypothetical protein